MKKTTLVLLFALSCGLINAQGVLKPATPPGKLTLPTPKIQPIAPADLQVTGVDLVSAVVKTDTKTIMVTVRVTVKNAGQTTSPVNTLAASAQSITPGSTWSDAGNTVQIQALSGSQSCTNEVTFKFPMGSVNGRKFNFRVMADAGARVHESNENNNYSQGILIGL